eukprot:2216232-Pleurochrysis_carterae.AAC.1
MGGRWGGARVGLTHKRPRSPAALASIGPSGIWHRTEIMHAHERVRSCSAAVSMRVHSKVFKPNRA